MAILAWAQRSTIDGGPHESPSGLFIFIFAKHRRTFERIIGLMLYSIKIYVTLIQIWENCLMNSRTVAAIVFKLFAVYLFVQVILQLPIFWQINYLSPEADAAGQSTPPLFGVLSLILLFVFIIIIAALIWILGTRALKQIPAETESSEQLEAVLFQVLGLYFIISAFSVLPGKILASLMPSHMSSIEIFVWLFKDIFILLVGLFLVAKAEFWKRLLRKMRS